MNTTHEIVFELEQEHQALQQEVDEWRKWWQELQEFGQPRFGEMGERLAHFQAHMQSHFRHEETSGPLAESANMSPTVQPRIRKLRNEHGQLLSELAAIIAGLSECGTAFANWGDARQGFEAFLNHLQRHDLEEHELFEELERLEGN
jgi:iron-sulfur cluster repair protein YtfE (RIC family)